MSSHKSPLRDRLLSNSPDPVKSSIIRDSGMGWISPTSNNTESQSSGSSGSVTSPLRISKRESPRVLPQLPVARRSSSSYRHVRNNNLVSKSPFKSQIPTPSSTPSSRPPISFPSSRRVSGEKRSRPSSMHEQAETENDRPFALKRERRQSRTYQGLIQKEPVTKSPFKQRTSTLEDQVPPPPPLSHLPKTPSITHIQPISFLRPSTTPISTLSVPPGRSSLVSKRMHGPRLSSGSRSKKERRKKVRWDERCDVVEFHKEEDETDEELFSSAEEGDEDMHPENEHRIEEDPFFRASQSTHIVASTPNQAPSYTSVQLSDTSGDSESLLGMTLDPDASISGLVEEIFSSSASVGAQEGFNSPHNAAVVTPPPTHHSDSINLPPDVDTENGVPFGRSHHAARFLEHHQDYSQFSKPSSPHFSPYTSAHSSPHQLAKAVAFNLSTEASPYGPPATPPRRSAAPSPSINTSHPSVSTNETSSMASSRIASPSPIPESSLSEVDAARLMTPPLGRSTHAERLRMAREDNCNDVLMLPGTPSPCKIAKRPVLEANQGEDLVLSFGLEVQSSDIYPSEDPFSPPSVHKGQAIEESPTAEPTQIPDNELQDTGSDYVVENTLQLISDHDSDYDRQPNHVSETHTTGDFCSPKDYCSPHQSEVSGDEQESLDDKSIEQPRVSRQRVKRTLLHRQADQSYSDGSRSSTPTTPATDQSYMQKEPSQTVDDTTDKDTVSVVTVVTDISTETAIIEHAERRTPTGANIAEGKEFGLLSAGETLQFDFGSNFGKGLDLGGLDNGFRKASLDSFGVICGPNNEKPSTVQSGSIKMGDVDVDMDMRSALDRLMDDVAGTKMNNSTISEDDSQSASPPSLRNVEGIITDSTLSLNRGFVNRDVSVSSGLSIPPPVPPKDNIRNRQQMILQKRREAKLMEEADSDRYTPSQNSGRAKGDQELLGVGRPSRRRSMSTGDIVLSVQGVGDIRDDQLGDSIERELEKLVEAPLKKKYLIREHKDTIYASASDPDIISHMAGPGDVNTGKAWRTVRRPSDMNEYSKQIKEFRAQEKSGKAYGKVFVKVLGVKGVHVKLPQQPTALTCTLNNGIHFVSTPECLLERDFRINQEFELIEHSKLEFTLTLKVRRDPHIITQFKALVPPAPLAAVAPPPVVQSSSKSGMRSFFSSSPKKIKDKPPVQVAPPPQPVHHLPENLARYLKPEGTLARAFISFKDIASRCDTRLFETSYPLIGQRAELGGKFSTLQVGEIVLQLFRLPPLPGVSPEHLPQSLEECHRGLRHVNWHKVTYFEGILTQCGGDCSTWRRRQFRVIGANLVAFNDVTKRATATIDLKKAIGIEDNHEARSNALNPNFGARSNHYDEYDGLYGVERSFRLIFPQEQEILFFADTDEEKVRWLDVLRALVGHIPPHPIWAELLWQRQEELRVPRPPSRPPTQPSPSWLVSKGPHR